VVPQGVTYPILAAFANVGRFQPTFAQSGSAQDCFSIRVAQHLQFDIPVRAFTHSQSHGVLHMVANKVCTTTVGIFNTREAANLAISELRQSGYSDNHIGLVARDAVTGKSVRTDGAGEEAVAEGAAIGAVAGAATGAVVGAGILMGVIPVIGPVLAIGTLGTILLNAAGGAAIATVAGALIGWGVAEEDAKFYEDEVKAGRYLVTVDRGTRIEEDPRGIMVRHGGYDRTTALRM